MAIFSDLVKWLAMTSSVGVILVVYRIKNS